MQASRATDVHVFEIFRSAADIPMLRYEAANGGSPLSFVDAVSAVRPEARSRQS